MSKFSVHQIVIVQHRRTGRGIPGVVSEVCVLVDPQGRFAPHRIDGQQQYRVDIGGTNLQAGEDQVSAI